MNNRGLSLIEVLVATLLLVGIGAAVARSSHAVRASRSMSGETALEASLAQTSLEEMLASDPIGWSAREDRDVLPSARGPLERTRTIEKGPRPDLWLLTVTISRPPPGRTIVLRTLRRRPWK